MIYHQIRFENNNDKNIDYTLLLDNSYYTSPTLSTPLSSPTNSLILDELPMYQHQNVSSGPTTSHQQNSYNISRGNASEPQQNDWLLNPFYNTSTLTYNPLLSLDSMPSNTALQSTPSSNNYNNQPNFNDFQSMMVMSSGPADTAAATPGTMGVLVQQQNDIFNHQLDQPSKSINEPVSSASSLSPPPSTKSKKKLNKKKPVPYAHQMRSLNFGYPAKNSRAYSSTRGSSSTSSPPQPSTPSSSSSSSATASSSTSLYSGSNLAPMATSDKGQNKKKSPSPYQCDFPGCQKSFTRPYNLKSHHRTHTNEKPFECPHCDKAFARQHDRNRHAKLHFGIKPYFCVYCYKAFARQDALTRHQIWVDESGVIGCSSLKRKSRKGSSAVIEG